MNGDFIRSRTFDEIRVEETTDPQPTLARGDMVLLARVCAEPGPTRAGGAYVRATGAKGQ